MQSVRIRDLRGVDGQPNWQESSESARPRENIKLPRSAIGVLIGFVLLGGGLLALGRRDYAQVHTILDTSMTLMSGILTLVLWDMGARTDTAFPKQLAIGFAATFALELIHVLVTVEWSGPFAAAVDMHDYLRPVTWPPAAHALPIGIAGAIWLARRGRIDALGCALAMAVLSGALLEIFRRLPPYVPPGPLGITRPVLILVPLLWMTVGWICWRRRAADRIFRPLTIMAAVFCLGAVSMLYSQAPHDTQAMVAHLSKASAGMVLLLCLMQMAASDMRERMRAERNLARLNEELEHRVVNRTIQLETANAKLEREVNVRRQAEQKAQDQLRRINLLHHIIRAIGERQDFNDLLQVVVGSVEQELPADFACLCFHDAVDNTLAVVRVGGNGSVLAPRLGMPERARVRIDAAGLSQCMAGELVYMSDLGREDSAFARQLAAGGVRSLVLAPLKTESEVFGLLVVARAGPQGFHANESEFLQQLSEHLALVVHQAQQ